MNAETTTIKQRKTYDTRVKYLVRKGLLPDIYRKQIHRSLIWEWERESPDKYTGLAVPLKNFGSTKKTFFYLDNVA